MKGLFITFEGPEGSGKTTQREMLEEALKKRDLSVVYTREPGGTAIGQQLREILLSPEHQTLNRMAEIFLFMADRSQHIAEVVKPAIENGQVVLCDRYVDSTLAYQVGGRQTSEQLLLDLNALSSQGLMPRRTYLLTVPPEVGLKRATQTHTDRFEAEALQFHERVLNKYLDLAKRSPQRILVLDGMQSKEAIHTIILKDFEELFKKTKPMTMTAAIPDCNPLIGHPTALQILSKQTQNPGAALFFYGPEAVGKKYAAYHFAHQVLNHQNSIEKWNRLWNNEHPNLISLSPGTKKNIGIQQIHEMKHQIQYGPRAGSNHLIVLIEPAEMLSGEAGNALLKTLEEPIAGVIFILVSSQPERCLSTIRSRTLAVPFGYLHAQEIQAIVLQNEWSLPPEIQLILEQSGHFELLSPKELSENIPTLFENLKNIHHLSIHDLLEWASEIASQKNIAQYYLKCMLVWWHQHKNYSAFQLVLDTLKKLSYNVNLKLQIESLLLSLKNEA